MSTTRTPTSIKAKAKASKAKAAKRTRRASVAESDSPAASDSTTTAAKPISGLDAAATILRDASEPLDVKTIVARMLERGLWTTAGKTPAATIYSAIIREIKAKGSGSRFLKADRGRFAAAG
jgi:hypothetical protein